MTNSEKLNNKKTSKITVMVSAQCCAYAKFQTTIHFKIADCRINIAMSLEAK